MDEIEKIHKQESEKYNWLPDFVYGGIDGAVTTFAVVAGVEGASLSVPIILILGVANLIADGFSMATGKYLSDRANQEQYQKIFQAEMEHIKKNPDSERKEVEDILRKYGFKGKKLKCATGVFTSDENAWVDLMMRNEFNLTQENISPIKGGFFTFISFVAIGVIPLIAYIFRPILNWDTDQTFVATIFATLIALFLVGTIKSKFTTRNWFISGLETSAIAGFGAAIAYTIGFLLRGLVG